MFSYQYFATQEMNLNSILEFRTSNKQFYEFVKPVSLGTFQNLK